MDKWKKRSVDLFTSLAFGSDGGASVVPYYPQKIAVSSREQRFFPRTIPEKKGISSKRIYNMLCELEREKRANVHSLMILRGGEVICECSRDGYGVNVAHISHSMSKSISGMVIGQLWDRGKIGLDARLADFFPEIKYKDKRFSQITVEHLLTMTCGIDFAELGSITDRNWTEAFFASSVKFAPGSKFLYNSMNTYLLARIAERVSSKPFIELAKEGLFEPMGISNYLWEKGPEGTEKAGWGLYMSCESWAKIGYMFLSGGDFFGKRILSSDWIIRCNETKAIVPEENGDFNYTYQMWRARGAEELLFNGMLGQNVWICPRNDIVAVLTGGNNELFADSPALEIIRKYLGGELSDKMDNADARILIDKLVTFFDSRRWAQPKEKRGGILCFLGLRAREIFDTSWLHLLGRYALSKNNHGILPLIVRAMQNNLDSSLQELSFERRGEELYMVALESGARIRIPIGFYEYKSSILDFRGEKYIVKAMGEAIVDANGNREYRIEIIFPELSSTRMIVIKRPYPDRISVSLSESPNNRIIDNYLNRMSSTSSAVSIAFNILERRFGRGFIFEAIKKTFNPIIVGADMDCSNYKSIVDSENGRVAEELNSMRLIRAVVDRFFKETPEKSKDK